MNVLFAAPEDAWGGILHRFRTALPEVTFTAGGLNPNTLAGYDVVIPTMSRIDAGLLQTADRLQLIQQIGAGLEGVDLEAARARGIAVANVPTDVSGNADSVAEMVIYFMLALMRRTAEHAEQRQKNNWVCRLAAALWVLRWALLGLVRSGKRSADDSMGLACARSR